MHENPGMDSKHLADMMQNIYKAQTSNPTMEYEVQSLVITVKKLDRTQATSTVS